MSYTNVFKRYELKYLLTPAQHDAVLRGIAPYMQLDDYGRTTIRNIYFDTEDYRLIRHSIDKPAYKEKLRVRSYKLVGSDDTVFVELKKKYDGVVYKRRIALPESVALDWLLGKTKSPCDTQISREIDYFMSFYGSLRPSMFLSYEREAFYERAGGDFRVTFDDNILCRSTDLSLRCEPSGHSVLPPNRVLMEIKCSGAIPLWMVKILSSEKIYKTSFSKYGRAYIDIVLCDADSKNTVSEEILINA